MTATISANLRELRSSRTRLAHLVLAARSLRALGRTELAASLAASLAAEAAELAGSPATIPVTCAACQADGVVTVLVGDAGEPSACICPDCDQAGQAAVAGSR